MNGALKKYVKTGLEWKERDREEGEALRETARAKKINNNGRQYVCR